MTPQAIGLLASAVAVLIGGLVALLKLRPEKTKIIVESATGLVVIQLDVIRDLRSELEKQDQRIEVLEGKAQVALQVRRDLADMTAERDDLHEANEALQSERVVWQEERRVLRADLDRVCEELEVLKRQVNGSGSDNG